MVNRIITVSSYGLCMFSIASFQSFLKENSIKSKKILKYFQDNKEVYLKAISKGVWLPILPIDSIDYEIKLSNLSESFDETYWLKTNENRGFNIDVENENTLWISSLGVFNDWDSNKYEGCDYTSYNTLDGEAVFNAFKIDIPNGKYHVNILGYKKKDLSDISQTNAGYFFELIPIDEFSETLDPREDDKYSFKIR